MFSDICERFGARIREVRNAKGMTQIELAEKAGIEQPYLSLVENGKQEPCLRNIELIATGLGVSIHKLFGEL